MCGTWTPQQWAELGPTYTGFFGTEPVYNVTKRYNEQGDLAVMLEARTAERDNYQTVIAPSGRDIMTHFGTKAASKRAAEKRLNENGFTYATDPTQEKPADEQPAEAETLEQYQQMFNYGGRTLAQWAAHASTNLPGVGPDTHVHPELPLGSEDLTVDTLRRSFIAFIASANDREMVHLVEEVFDLPLLVQVALEQKLGVGVLPPAGSAAAFLGGGSAGGESPIDALIAALANA